MAWKGALAEMTRSGVSMRWDGLADYAAYRMPRLDGEQFLLLSRLMWPQTPTVLLSAEHTDLPVILKMQGACALVPKPFDSQGLLRTLQSAVEAACSCCSPSSIPREGTNNTLSVAPS
jgi:DNA-binding NtrC family response regulator